MTSLLAAKWLVTSGCLAIFLSCFLGVAMLIPHQTGSSNDKTAINFKHVGAAHIDWIMLGLMTSAAGGLIVLFDLRPPASIIGLMIFGAWINPLSYVFKAFGINAFQFGGSTTQRLASLLGGVSSLSIIAAWLLVFAMIVLTV
jgi:hypothetical protein